MDVEEPLTVSDVSTVLELMGYIPGHLMNASFDFEQDRCCRAAGLRRFGYDKRRRARLAEPWRR